MAFAGLNPRHHTASSSIHKTTHISKRGQSRPQAALYLPAVIANQHKFILAAFAARLQARGVSGKHIAAIMRKLLHLIFGVLKSGRPLDPNFVPLHP